MHKVCNWSLLEYFIIFETAEEILGYDLLLFCINGGLYKMHAESYSQLNYDQYQFASPTILQIDTASTASRSLKKIRVNTTLRWRSCALIS